MPSSDILYPNYNGAVVIRVVEKRASQQQATFCVVELLTLIAFNTSMCSKNTSYRDLYPV